jgi:hypothetical protein
MNKRHTQKLTVSALLLVLLLLAAACGQNNQPADNPPTAVEPTGVEPTAVALQEDAPTQTDVNNVPVQIDSNGEVPFYARFGENETFSNGEWAFIIFYRSPDCIPADFNLNLFFHFPDENGPGAFGCTQPTTTSVELWANGPETDPAPLVAEMAGRGAVPVWFFSEADIDAAMADGVVTIDELAALPSRMVGTAASYTELLHPSQSNAQPLIQFTAEGVLADGRAFLVDVSQGAPDVANHITIEIGE